MWGISDLGQIAEISEPRSVDICCTQETRFRKPVGMMSGKATNYKLFWIGNEKGFRGAGIFLAKKWVDKVTDICRTNTRMIVIKV